MDLGFDDHPAGAFGQQVFRDLPGRFRSFANLACGHSYAVLAEQLFRLILVNVHFLSLIGV
jgi:hypothetical protein